VHCVPPLAITTLPAFLPIAESSQNNIVKPARLVHTALVDCGVFQPQALKGTKAWSSYP
jgi:hypothetical protein